jgi:hypothetical protein
VQGKTFNQYLHKRVFKEKHMTIRQFFILLKRILCKPVNILLILVIPFLAVLVAALPKGETETNVVTGIYTDDTDMQLSNIINQLSANDSGFIFEEISSLEELKDKVISGYYDSGYYIPQGFTDTFKTDTVNSRMDVYVSPSSMFTTVTSEMIYNQLLRTYSPDIIINYAKTNDYISSSYNNAYDSYIDKMYDEYISSPNIFKLESNDTGDYNVKAAGINTFPLYKLTGFIIFLSALLGMMIYLKDNEKGVYARLSRKKKIKFCAMNIIANMTPVILMAFVTLLIYGTSMSPVMLALHLLFYMVICIVWVIIYRAVFRSYRVYVSGIPITIICTLILSPVFIDMTKYLWVLKFVSYIFPTTYF